MKLKKLFGTIILIQVILILFKILGILNVPYGVICIPTYILITSLLSFGMVALAICITPNGKKYLDGLIKDALAAKNESEKVETETTEE